MAGLSCSADGRMMHRLRCEQECDRARELLAGVQAAFPEVAQLVRTVQLSHKILFKKGAFIAELAQTGVALSNFFATMYTSLLHRF